MNQEYEHKLRGEVELGAKAEKWLKDEVGSKAIEAVRSAIIEKWCTSPLRDMDGQHELRLMLKLLDDVVGYVKKAVKDGQFAASQIGRERSVKQRVKDAGREFVR